MIYALEALRFLAVLLIYFHHLSYPGGLGPSAVTFFFVLSGFVISYNYGNEFSTLDSNELKSFYVRRLSKVYPLHILTFIVSLPLLYYTNFQTNLFFALLNIFLLQSFFPIGIQVFSFNSLSWFLSDIVLFYLVSPFLLSGLNQLKMRRGTGVLLVLSILLFACEVILVYTLNAEMQPYSLGWWFVYISPWLRIFDYTIGLLAGLICVSIKADENYKNMPSRILFGILEIMALVMFGGAIYYAQFFPSDSLRMGTYYVPFSVIFILIFSLQKGILSSILSRRIFVYLGSLSFTLFIVHQIVIRYLAFFFKSPVYLYTPGVEHLAPQLILLLSLIILSDIIVRFFEKPLGKKILVTQPKQLRNFQADEKKLRKYES